MCICIYTCEVLRVWKSLYINMEVRMCTDALADVSKSSCRFVSPFDLHVFLQSLFGALGFV